MILAMASGIPLTGRARGTPALQASGAHMPPRLPGGDATRSGVGGQLLFASKAFKGSLGALAFVSRRSLDDGAVVQ